MDLELRHLRIVRAVAEAGSVTKAASHLGLAQPALTAQLKRIERLLGGTLFDRDHQGARPTPLGELVLSRAMVLLPAARELQEEARRLANANADIPRYRLGATNGPILGGLMDRLATAWPSTPVSTHTSWSARELTGMVILGKLDFVFTGACGESLPPAEGPVVWLTVGIDPVFVLLNEDHPLARRAEVDLAELADEQWTVTPGDSCFGDCFATACARAGFTPRTIYETDVATCMHLAQVGRAAALCQATFQPAEGLRLVPLAGAPLRWRQLFGWHPESPAAGAAPSIFEHAKAAHADAVRRSRRYAVWLADNPGLGTSR
ncbi:DNA-binding transcriptional LysR family regulator [Streptosporangium becharense]|uniref:DNA-binding transcriptional LysR family regulator n=1 Tax=Streptosporangium becharense TaxID=1816182 RepID=A0A7W9IDB8_9ACTN|nr:LysR family transcriptional regulator [Streptosporangium becharense]MBB2912035.1 DNA-binding transcriptional LysR family regulator [Streptosporangium becharense]MBB5818582.1 DNA-binding transcriptional LysR family regulator [Streptosporangium becharense]